MTSGPVRSGDYTIGARMLLGIATGDSYGAPFENRPYNEIEELLNTRGFISGRYTDDTQQALALAELMASGESFTRERIAQSFLTAYHRDPRSGYSKVTKKMLSSPDPDSFLSGISQEDRLERKTDGAAMRALPIGFFPDRNEVIRNSILSAAITHGHPDAIAATVAVALIAHEKIYHNTSWDMVWNRIRDAVGEINPEIISYCDRCARLTVPDRTIILEEHAGYGVPFTESRIFLGSILALLLCFGDEPYRLLTESVLLGGDTDTVAAVALGESLITGKDNRVWDLISGLEEGPYGKEFLIKTGDRLSAHFPARGGLK